MSADNFVGVWFDGKQWRVASNLSASAEYKTRQALERAFTVENGVAYFGNSRENALCYAHDLDASLDSEYGVIELHEEPPHSVRLRRCTWCAAITVEEIRYGSITVTKDGGGDECPRCGKELEPTAVEVAVGDAYVR